MATKKSKPSKPKAKGEAKAKKASSKKAAKPASVAKKPAKSKASTKKAAKPASTVKKSAKPKTRAIKPDEVPKMVAVKVSEEPPVEEEIPQRVPDAVENFQEQRVPINKSLYEKPPEEIDAPWRLPGDDEDTGRNRHRMSRALLVATLLLGIFNSGALVNWVRGLPAGPIEDGIIVSAETWHDWMEEVGLSDHIDRIAKQIQSLKNAKW